MRTKFNFLLSLLLSMTIISSYGQLARCKGKYFGNITAYSVPSNYTQLWNQTTSENGSKWGSCDRGNGVYNFGNSDLAYNTAKNSGGAFKFHALIWGAQAPGYLANASPAQIETAIRNWYQAVQDHYDPMGGLDMIDVLNEPVNTPINREIANLKAALTMGYQREAANQADLNNPYGWAIWCFQLARKHFPNSVLLINEFNTEHNWGNCREEYIRMANAIKNAPNLTTGEKNLIDGIGLQAHGIETLSATAWANCINEIGDRTGLAIHISEFDLAADPNEAHQGTKFQEFITIAWEHPNVAGITLWGYVQGATWRPGNGQAGPGGTDTGIQYSNLTDRPAMTWLKSYLASKPSLPCCPDPAPFADCSNSNDPTVTLISPAGDQSVEVPEDVYIEAEVSDPSAINTLQFFVNGEQVGATEWVEPYFTTLSISNPGDYEITAVITLPSGTQITSDPITVKANIPQGPYSGTSHNIPGIIQSEEFDAGGNGFAYFDDSPGTETGVDFRTDTDVDIEVSTDVGGGYNIGWATTNEWLEYTVNVTQAGTYDLSTRLARDGNNGIIHIEMDGVDITGPIAVPNTGGWQAWETVVVNNINLTAGTKVMRIVFDTDYTNLNYVSYTLAGDNEAPTVSITGPASGAIYESPASITLTANATDSDGGVASVAFYNGNTLIGTANTAPYSYTWTGVGQGNYQITAVATDIAGATTTSSAIAIEVTPGATTNTSAVKTYMNPVIPGSHPDQTLMKDGDYYYTAGSSFHWAPNFPIYRSTDLVHWEIISNVVDPNWTIIKQNATPKDGTWQGALAKFAGKYWAFFYIHGAGQFFCTASSMEGPWSAPTQVQGSIGYDNAVFVDDNGKAYMLMKNGQDFAAIQEINANGQLTGTRMDMSWVNRDHVYSWAEGPKMCKRNGRYYYFVAGNVYGGQYVLSSATLTGDEAAWTRHGNYFRGNATGPFTGPNHVSQPVQIADGTWWTICHSYGNNGWQGQGRQSMLFRVYWDENGVPYSNNPNGQPLEAPNLPSMGVNYEFPHADDFSSTTRAKEWYFHNVNDISKVSVSARPGFMRIIPGTGTMHVLQRDPAKRYTLVTKVEINATTNGQHAGLRLMNGEDALFLNVYSGYNNGKKFGISFGTQRTEVNNTIGNTVWLKLVRNQHAITGFYSADGDSWTQIGSFNVATLDEAQTNDNAWVGTSLGLYATGQTADFDEFAYNYGFDPLDISAYYHYGNISTSGGSVTNTANGGFCMLPGVSMEVERSPANQIVVSAASNNANGTLEVWIDNIEGPGTRIAQIPITNTGGTNTYQDFTANVNVSGQHDLYFRFVGASGVFRINEVEFISTGGPLVSFTSPVNNYVTTSPATIALQATAEDGNGTISNVKFYDGSRLLSTDNNAPYAYNWTNVAAGTYTLRAVATDNDGNTAEDEIVITVNVPQGPFGGTPHPIPGTIQTEDYDVGGQGFAYNDIEAANQGNSDYRAGDGVDVETTGDNVGTYNVGYIMNGEWLEYTVDVATTGAYDVDLRVAKDGTGGLFHIEMDGNNITGAIAVPNTGGWQTWETVTLNDIQLTAGEHIMRVAFDSDYMNINFVTFSLVVLDADNDGVLTEDDCDDNDPQVGAATNWYVDADGDGLGVAGTAVVDCDQPTGYVDNADDNNDADFDNDGIASTDDCDDTNANIGVATTWYADADGDGLGNASVSQTSCTQPAGYVSNSNDTNDDDFDNDGITTADDCDDTNANIGVATTWYADADGDGLGNASVSQTSCTQPAGYVSNSTDTNDDDFDNDGIATANDCDDTDANIGEATTWYADADGDGLGNASASQTACTQPTGYVSNSTDTSDDDYDNDGIATADDCDDANANVGVATTWYADADGDGFGDASVSQTACTQPTGYVSNSNDTNDDDFDNDGIASTDDCDDANANVGTGQTWYQDQDNDGLGDPTSSVQACVQPNGYVANGNDGCVNDATNTCNDPTDCAGVPNGTSFLDNCNNCVASQAEACEQDCNGDWGGTATEDVCGVCTGGQTGLVAETDEKNCDGGITGFESFTADELTVYPNPTDGLVHLSARAKWSLYNALGGLIEKGESDVVDLSVYASGVYVLKLETRVVKLVKQ